MKKRIILCFLASLIALSLALLVNQTVLSSSLLEKEFKTKETTAIFPSELQFIGEKAFEGTAFGAVVFSDILTTIEDRAFYGSDSLTAAYIPPSVVYIGESAFPNAVTVHGVGDSYVQKWVDENDFEFIADDIWIDTQSVESVHLEGLFYLFWVIRPPDEKALRRFSERIRSYFKSMRPQDRPELYSIHCRFP